MMDGYRPFKKDRQGMQEECVAHCIKVELDCTVPAAEDDMIENFCIRIRGKADVVVRVYYR